MKDKLSCTRRLFTVSAHDGFAAKQRHLHSRCFRYSASVSFPWKFASVRVSFFTVLFVFYASDVMQRKEKI